MAFTINWPSFWKGRYEKAFEENLEYLKIISDLDEELEALKALKIPETVRPQVKEIARENGHIYYIFDDLTNIPFIRSQQIGHLLHHMNSGITPEYIGELLKRMHTAIWGDGDPEELDTLRRELEERHDFGFNSNVLYQIAANIIIRDDEPHDSISNMIFNEKIAHWRESEAGGFFLTIACGLCMEQYLESNGSTRDGLKKDLKALIKREKELFDTSKTKQIKPG